MSTKMKIKRGDTVVVISGDDRGNKGEVLKCFPKTNKAMVRGVNLKRKHVKPSQKMPQGGIVELEGLIDVSNLSLLDPSTGLPTKVKYVVQNNAEGTVKLRYAKRSGQLI